jgi:hypothetical protein
MGTWTEKTWMWIWVCVAAVSLFLADGGVRAYQSQARRECIQAQIDLLDVSGSAW